MTGRYITQKDPHKRAIMFDREPRNRILTRMIHEHLPYTGNNNIDHIQDHRFHYAHYLHMKRMAFKQSATKIRNRCIFTGNARAVSSLFRMSRFTFKMFARNGRINGLTKSSW
jgi:ribosomal protein S14